MTRPETNERAEPLSTLCHACGYSAGLLDQCDCRIPHTKPTGNLAAYIIVAAAALASAVLA